MNGFEQELAAVQTTNRSERRHDVDALRVILFGLLIWLHFVSLCTWTQEPAPLQTNTLAMLIVGVMHQWRLAALFVISGMGTAFAFGSRTWPSYLWERVVRLFVPLVFATYVLLGGFVNPVDTTSRFLEIFPGISRMPYGHLWFIYNLLIYSVVLTPLFVCVRRKPNDRVTHGLRTLMTMPFAAGLLIAPPLLFAFSDVLCKPWVRGEVGMWWEFPRYFLYFAVGYLLISVRQEYFAALQRIRFALIPLTVVLTIIFVMSESLFGVPDLAIGGWVNQGYPAFSFWAALGAFALELHAWVWCLFIFAWAAQFLNRPSRWIDYLNQAVYCSYIVHFTMALLAAAVVYRLKLEYTPGLIAGLVIQTVFCLAFFEIAKRSRLGQVLFGIKLPIHSTTTETVSVLWSRLSAATNVVVLCCTVFGLVVYGWQIGKRHFVPIRAHQEGSVQKSEAAMTYVTARQSPDIAPEIDALVQASCIHCHDASTETALNLESLSGDLTNPESMRKWVHVFDRVRDGTMPPEFEARPDAEIVRAATGALENWLHEFSMSQQQRAGRVPARRLTRSEYRFTVQDLLGIQWDATKHLPEEVESGSFDTVGYTQRLSAIHVDGLLQAAEEALAQAIALGPNPYLEVRLDFLNSANLRYFDDKKLHEGGNIMRRLEKGVVVFVENDYLIHSYRSMGVSIEVPGNYRIAAQFEAFQAQQPVTYKIIAKRPSGDASLIKVGDLDPGESADIETDVYLEPGDSFYVTMHADDHGAAYIALRAINVKDYQGPGLAIRSLGVAGPIHEEWPPKSTRDLLHGVELVTSTETGATEIKLSKPPMEHVREIVGKFAERAFRRPVQPAEIESFVELARPAIEEGLPFEEVIRVPLRSILCSPQFLMHAGQPGDLDSFSLASRLSCFLWKSLPDAELLDSASIRALNTDVELARQVDRMLEDPRSQRFVNDFVGQWLRLHKINATSPDAKLYPEFDELLGDALPQETQLFFAHLIRENASLNHLIDSDYTFVNRRLAEHYGLQNIQGQHFRKVQLPAGSPRGGVLTQAAILKTTANGTVTSPVTRGNFVLTNLLGTPPSPPPPGVGSIEPDTRGKTTIREVLVAHRDNESCQACHRKIDPPGFALESFDPIGRLRTNYRSSGPGEGFFAKLSPATYHDGPSVDPSGETADGRKFKDIVEFKRILMDRKEQIARNFVSQLIVYSTGGEIEFADREVVEAILKQTEADNYPVRDLIHAVVQSRLFRHK